MKSWLLRVNVVTVAVCSSYLTLGLANPQRAQSLWAVYAALTFCLALLSLALDRKI